MIGIPALLLNQLAQLRLAIPIIVGVSALAVLMNELTYSDTTTTLKWGIALTDARIATARVLQVLTDAETAQRGYLLTARGDYLEPLEAAKRELPGARRSLRSFLASTGNAGQAAADRLDADIDQKLAELDTTIALLAAGDRPAALALVESGVGKGTMDDIRQIFATSLSMGASLQQKARVSLFDALLLNRLALSVLTLLSAAVAIVYIGHVRHYDRERAGRQQELETQVNLRTAELRELSLHLQAAREDEKASLARELHDELGGLLTAVKLDLARVRAKVASDPAVLERLEQANARLNEGIALKRRVIENLRPSALTNLGLAASLRILCSETSAGLGIPIYAEIDEFESDPDLELTIYRVLQESLTNISKYAQASEVQVRLATAGEHVRLEVVDDGVGFEPNQSPVGKHGVSGMRFRVTSLGGSLRVDSAPGRGTTLLALLPLQSVTDRMALAG